jgi:hypothetical protein
MAWGMLAVQGRAIRITVGITDQFAEEYKLKGLTIETHDAPARAPSNAERLHKLTTSIGVACRLSKSPIEATKPAMPWTYEPGPKYLSICEAILNEEKRSYAHPTDE